MIIMRRFFRRSPILLISVTVSGLVTVLILLNFIIWASAPFGPSPEALDALQSTDKVNVVDHASWISFQPVNQSVDTGLIFYPEGKVEFRSYAPTLKKIAEAGYLVVLPNMPLNLAFFEPEKASQIIDSFPKIIKWAVGGHSLGGSMAALFTANHPDQVQGLVLWASTPLGIENLNRSQVKVLMVFGTLDGLVPQSKVEAARSLLPVDTLWVPIIGGDHAQFGNYGAQPGDNPALLSALEQQNQATIATIHFLQTLPW